MAVYFAQAGKRVKIGWARDAARRLRELQTGCPVPLRIVREIPGGGAEERWLHWRYRDLRLDGEWFRYCPTMLSIGMPVDLTVPREPRPSSGRPVGRPRKPAKERIHVMLETRNMAALAEMYPDLGVSARVEIALKDVLSRPRRAKGGAA